MAKADDPQLVLYHFPGACSQVAICALEAANLSYRLELVNLAAGEQNSEEYLRVNPLGKVPLMVIDGEPLAENAAILTYIAALKPEASLFPVSDDPRMRAEIVGGMSFCGGTLHPNVRAFANPARLTAGDTAPVSERGGYLLAKACGPADARLAERGWWLGERSIVDVYIAWAFSVAKRAGFPVEKFPHLDGLATRLEEWPAYRRMVEINAECAQRLKM